MRSIDGPSTCSLTCLRKLMVPQQITQPSSTRANGQSNWSPVETTDIPSLSQAFLQPLLISRPGEGRRLSWPGHSVD